MSILSPTKGIPALSAARMQRWALLLSAYTYDISYRPTKSHANADALSRLPLEDSQTNNDSCGVHFDSLFNFGQLEALPITAKSIAAATRTDPLLAKVITYVNSGWPNHIPPELKPYSQRKHEIAIEGNCLLWGIKVLIPKKLHQKVLQELHLDHPGISRMKSLARSYVWWPNLDADIEAMVKSCLPCLSVKPAPPKAPLNPWVLPSRPWSRIHIDFAGPLNGKTYLVIVDVYSKWPEVFKMASTSAKTIDTLRHVFAAHGLPDQLVSDNGPQFTSDEFTQFLRRNGIKHVCTAPYHPATNGLAERFVKTLKKAILAGKEDGRSPQHKLSSFLLTYRSTLHAVTNVAPSVLLNNRSLKVVLDLVKPDIGRKVQEQQGHQKKGYDQHVCDRQFEVGDTIVLRMFQDNHSTWEPGIIAKKLSHVTFIVELEDKSQRHCHINQIRKRILALTTEERDRLADSISMEDTPDLSDSLTCISDSPLKSDDSEESGLFELLPVLTPPPPEGPPLAVSSPRYPTRVHKPSDRFF